MTIPIGAEEGGNDNNGQGDNSGINPAWNDVLSAVPEDQHSQVIPHLRTWDSNFQRVQSDYAPFKEFKDAGINADQIKMGMGLMQALEQNPRQVYDLLQQQFNFGAESGQGESEAEQDDPYENLPDAVKNKLATIDELEKKLETVTQWAVTQQSASSEAQEDEALENLIDGLKAKHGEFDERYVLSLMQAGMQAEEAVSEYKSVVERITTEARRPQAPKILGSGSTIPGENRFDVNKMDPKQTKDYVAQMLAHSAAQNRL